jgi:hypothetical protein
MDWRMRTARSGLSELISNETDACDDFYAHACGTFLQKQIPHGNSQWAYRWAQMYPLVRDRCGGCGSCALCFRDTASTECASATRSSSCTCCGCGITQLSAHARAPTCARSHAPGRVPTAPHRTGPARSLSNIRSRWCATAAPRSGVCAGGWIRARARMRAASPGPQPNNPDRTGRGRATSPSSSAVHICLCLCLCLWVGVGVGVAERVGGDRRCRRSRRCKRTRRCGGSSPRAWAWSRSTRSARGRCCRTSRSQRAAYARAHCSASVRA